MTRLYQHLRVHQIFGANTDVGKTILTTALCRASSLRQKRVFYLKPVSTGASVDADDGSVLLLILLAELPVQPNVGRHIKQFSGTFRDRIQTHCLFRYNNPVSPHLAAQLSQEVGKMS